MTGCPLITLALGLTLRAFAAGGEEREELIREALAVLAGIARE